MDRLTEKNKFDTHYGISISKNLLQSAYDKLGKLEDLEEELGCPLEVLFALIKGEKIYHDKLPYWEDNYSLRPHWDGHIACIVPIGMSRKYHLKDYKKTWWLKKDKSE